MELLSLFRREGSSKNSDFQILFSTIYNGLVYFACNILDDRDDAEDIVQDAFVKYWNSKDEIAPDIAAQKSYLYSTVKNSCLNFLRHKIVAKKYEDQLTDTWIDDRIVINSIIHAEVLSEIHNAIESLPLACRQISKMSFLEEKKNQEIADELGLSVNTVKTQKQRAMHMLREKLTLELFYVMVLAFYRH
ncbi:RNA polymerase sigma-70 factor [Dyadobacter sp. LHD-138]|uniref:RNA polymerase sigma-70 factor n=1 Tax=Dyadobacter sp. LHD-138 TaxID=3071413 RepID=UPI0027E00BF4|nr:RNA polymerase sigma-70 factor [Dyadobacter sp. LHD-138]MDQ6479421.1 RNA polymerase sigma-70 factor [Dyadobacter sp. LHD-138]